MAADPPDPRPCEAAATVGGDPFFLRIMRPWTGRFHVVHAAAPCVSHSHHVYTACGRLITDPDRLSGVQVTCPHCRAVDPKRYGPP